MRNIIVLRDQLYSLVHNAGLLSAIVSVSFDKGSANVYALLQDGTVLTFSDYDDTIRFVSKSHAFIEGDDGSPMIDNKWFSLTFVAGTGSVVAISHSGAIVSLEPSGSESMICELIGSIEGGIATAKWSPDQSSLTIVTNNNTILVMSSTWDVLQEIPITERLSGCDTAGVSWRGDGEGLAVLTVDNDDQTCRVRMYNPLMEIQATGRNIADGPASVMKGIGRVVAYATNGSYIAVCQEQKTGTGGCRLQVALVERNGLRHGDFDLQLPPVPTGWDKWEECSLHWDLPSTLLAVGLRAVRLTETPAESIQQGRPCLMQLYYRGNYHWYLKQQWAAEDLRFLGFDEELVHRCYMSQTVASSAPEDERLAVLRVVDIAWDVCTSATADSTVAVIDGSRLLLTPLGINNIPPPMCKHTLTIAAELVPPSVSTFPAAFSTRCCCFWQIQGVSSVANAAWGLATLCGDNRTVVVIFGNQAGDIIYQQTLDIRELCGKHTGNLAVRMSTIAFRSIAVTQSGNALQLVLLGSESLALSACLQAPEFQDSAAADVLAVISLDMEPAKISVESSIQPFLVPLPAGSVTRVFQAPHLPCSVGVGVIRAGSDGSEFEVYRVFLGRTQEDSVVQLVATLPEQCTHLAFIMPPASITIANTSDILASNAIENDNMSMAVVALSLRGRLYCNESLLSSGVSSFSYNESFGMLMFATVGTRPHLHFCSIQRLLALDALQHSDAQESAECAEPRPIERGARLVITAEGSSRVVMQLPRGNLETIEPRPLILLRAQHLIHAGQLLDCLVLLRKQRVDLNYLIDYSPRIFFDRLPELITSMLKTNHDLISLLITALEPVDVTLYKYPLDRNCQALQEPRDVQNFIGADKVNKVCAAVRNVLLPVLLASRQVIPMDDVHSSRILQPILCTFARQQPAQLVEALDLVRLCCTKDGVISSTTTGTGTDTVHTAVVVGGQSNLSSLMAQVSIKYLAFLAEGAELFDAALGICDFDMSRAVARQCQMDPKAYLPLVESFEAIGRGFSLNSPHTALMHFKVNAHLKRHTRAIDWVVHLLQRIYLLENCSDGVDTSHIELRKDIVSVIYEVKSFIKAETLHTYALPRLSGLQESLSLDPVTVLAGSKNMSISEFLTASECSYAVLVCRLLSDLRLEYGLLCASKMEYSEAIASILATRPVYALEAIEVAKQMGNWQLALSIAARFQHDERYRGQSEISPEVVAQQLVSEFRENQEQAEAFGNLTNAVETSTTGVGSAASEQEEMEDKVVEAARLSVDYCHDHEGAIAILTTAQRWLPALQLSMRFARKDLFSEIATATRTAAETLIRTLPSKALKVRALVDELAALWVNPAERLQNVASTDVTLMDELNGVDAEHQRQQDDTMSEYSAATQQSTFSRSSARSDSSRYSTKSGTSVVSVLSNLSAASGLSSATGGQQGDRPASAFVIEGLDHTLLSRGTVTARSDAGSNREPGAGKDGKRSKKQYKRDQTERRQKRIERSKAKGASKDVWGLRREGTVCEELLSYAHHLRTLTKVCKELCEALQLIAANGDHALATALQQACDAYMRSVQQHPPCVAPNYPPEWLVKRALGGIRHFQDPHSLALSVANTQAANGEPGLQQLEDLGSRTGAAAVLTAGRMQTATAAVTTWWDIAAAGLKAWYATYRLAFSNNHV